MGSTSKNRNPAGVLPGQVLGADTTRGSRSKFVDRTVLKQYERLAGFRTVEDNRFVMQLSIQIRLQIGSHDAMDRTWQEAKNHPIGVMNSPAGQIEPPTERHFFEGVFDGHDYLVHGDDLIDGGVFEEEHVTRERTKLLDFLKFNESVKTRQWKWWVGRMISGKAGSKVERR
jgi:hypothetical protein